MKRKRAPVSVRSGQIEFLKLNTEKWDWRDAYQWLLGLTWPQFGAFVGAVYISLNLLFASLYTMGGDCVAGMRPGSFLDAFFFSVQTIATVGYGNMSPANLYGNILTTIEIMSGIFLVAVMAGLIFVRFSRPSAHIVFSKSIVIAPLNGKPTLMLRVGNLHQRSMVEAEFRIFFNRDEPLVEGGEFRYFYNLKLVFDRMPTFPAALTLRHVIDEQSPLHGATPESLEASRTVLLSHRSSVSIQSFPRLSRLNRITPGGTCGSASVLWRFTPTTAMVDSQSTTAGFTTPNRRDIHCSRSLEQDKDELGPVTGAMSHGYPVRFGVVVRDALLLSK